ncbi:MAG: PQQ-binding-like beta-propeller repeat protein [Planctomycetota bacterium]
MACLICIIVLTLFGQVIGDDRSAVAAVEKVPEFRGVAATNSVAWSADGATLLAGNPSGDLYLFDADTGALRRTISGGDAFVPFATFSPDETFIAAADYAGRLSIYETASGKLLARQRGHDAETTSAAVHPDGNAIATGGKDGNLVLWNWDGEQLTKVRQIDKAVRDFANQVAFNPEGSSVATTGFESREDRTGLVAVFDVQTGEPVMRVVVPAFANSIEFGPAGETIYVGTAVGKVRGYDVATGGPIRQDPADVEVVANDISLLVEDGRVTGVIAACGDGILRRATFDRGIDWAVRANGSICFYAALSPSGDRVATSGNDGSLRIFDTDGKLLRTIGGR